ncbi:MAG TPA: hypothetical protein VIL49_09265 [Capillimicrobium sp.]
MTSCKLLAAAGAALALSAGAAAPALADSIVYVSDHDVWLMQPDGSGKVAVTRDGTAEAPYRHPTQDDRGRIAVAHEDEIVVLKPSGKVVRRFATSDLEDSTGHASWGFPSNVAISPDGKRIAFVATSASCDPTIDCGVRGTIGVVAATGRGATVQPGTYGGSSPSWISPTRLMFHGGFQSQNRIFDLGADTESRNWFDDLDVHPEGSTDLGDGDVSADGRWYAAVRGYDASARVAWHRTAGDVRGERDPAAPAPVCETSPALGTHGPSLAPDGSGIAAADPEGIWVKLGLESCDGPGFALVAPGGAEPDWGPAEIAPRKPARGKRG